MFINAHREEFGVVPICRALAVHGVQIAPRTYWAHRLAAPSKRALWDTTITEILAGIYEPDPDGKRPPECLYGSLKMWAHLQRQGIPVAGCTVEKIMRAHGWRGATRARRPPRTTESDPAANRAPDLVGRRWRVAAPNLLVVADFTYVPMVAGFGYTAFVVDAYAGLIPGWECSLTKDTGFVERALRHAAAIRSRQGHPFIPQNDGGGRPRQWPAGVGCPRARHQDAAAVFRRPGLRAVRADHPCAQPTRRTALPTWSPSAARPRSAVPIPSMWAAWATEALDAERRQAGNDGAGTGAQRG